MQLIFTFKYAPITAVRIQRAATPASEIEFGLPSSVIHLILSKQANEVFITLKGISIAYLVADSMAIDLVNFCLFVSLGREIADIILPGSAYTEQDGYFTNLEGKIQKAYKASYPPGDAKEDWQIINELAELMNNRKLFNDKDELESSMLNYLNLEKEKQINVGKENTKTDENEFKSETLNIVVKDYYFSNVIARSSKTMVECNNSKLNLKSTGTEG